MKSKKVLKSLDTPLDDPNYIELKNMLGKHQGYLGKFTEWLFKDNIPMGQLQSVYNEIQSVGLDKPIEQFKTPEEVYDYLTEYKISRSVNQILKSLPSRTRRIVNDNLRNLIKLNIQYKESIQDFYSKKGGRYKNINDLYKDTENLINNLSGGWGIDSIKYQEDELVYKDNHTLILWIKYYDRSCELGSQHWCISTDKSMWDDYTDDFNKQYFIYDFTKKQSDKKSMIGVTIGTNGTISDCHYRDDTPGDKKEVKNLYGQYLKPHSKEYIKPKININDITEVSKYGLVDEVKKLIENGIDPSDNNNYAIKWASKNGHLEIVKLLLQDKRVDPSANNNYAIKWASKNGHTEVVKLLLEDPRVDPSDYYNYAIRYASDNDHVEVVKLLLQDKRVDPSDMDNNAIRLASENGHTEVVKLLLQDKRVDPSDDDNYAIRYSSANGHVEVVKLLLEDPRVYNSLSEEDIKKYKDRINIYYKLKNI